MDGEEKRRKEKPQEGGGDVEEDKYGKWKNVKCKGGT